MREVSLNVSWFENLFDARWKITAWQKEYNEERPHKQFGISNSPRIRDQDKDRELWKRRRPRRLGKRPRRFPLSHNSSGCG
jgi:hypothetical protein